MIQPKMVPVYAWEDIDAEIAKRVGVKDLYGGYFNPETGEQVDVGQGEYRNFWHKALDCFVPDQMRNGVIVTMFNIFDWESDRQVDYLTEHGYWTKPYFQAYHDIMNELDPNDNGIEVSFNW